MRSHLIVVFMCLSTLLSFSQSSPKYQTATVTDVKPHQPASDSDRSSYEVSLRVKNAVYVALYTPSEDTDTVKYVAGREVLVLVGEKTIKSNDLLGTPFEMPILSKKNAADANKGKLVQQ
jgi:hypothetical protein